MWNVFCFLLYTFSVNVAGVLTGCNDLPTCLQKRGKSFSSQHDPLHTHQIDASDRDLGHKEGEQERLPDLLWFQVT